MCSVFYLAALSIYPNNMHCISELCQELGGLPTTHQAPYLAAAQPKARGRHNWKNLARCTPLILFRDSSASLPLPLSRRITVNLAIFGKFRWGRWRRPGAPFSSCRRGLQPEPSRGAWGPLVPCVPEPQLTRPPREWWGSAYPVV